MAAQKNSKKFTQLSQDEMIEIYKYRSQGLSCRAIGRIMDRSHTTISREIERNSIDHGWGVCKYKPLIAQEKKQKRRQQANMKHIKLRTDNRQRSKLYELLSDKEKCWGVDEILGYLRTRLGRKTVSTSTAYRYIRAYTDWGIHLRYGKDGYTHKKRKRKKTTTLKDVPRIDERPLSVNNREGDADREIDTIVDPGHISGLFTCTNRKARYSIIRKIPNHKADTLLTIMTHALKDEKVETITSDNGVEFARLAKLGKRLKAKCYAAHPGASYERGTNEKHNGFIRRFIPKKAKSTDRTDKEIETIQNMLNHKPRKILGYRTPYEVYHNTTIQYVK